MTKSKDKIIAREEWDFSKCPPDWQEACAQWEYRRERYRLMSKKERLKIPQAEMDDYMTPFLLHGTMRVIRDSSKQELWHEALGLAEIYYSLPSAVGLPKWVEAVMPAAIEDLDGKNSHLRGSKEFLAMCIDWERADERIIEAFTLWLKVKRPCKAKKEDHTANRQASRKLNALAVYRLLKHFKTAKKGIEHCESERPILYSNPDRWSKANSLAKSILGIAS